MPRVLLINANTTQSVTDLIERHARAAAGAEVAQVEFRAVTATFGAPYVCDERSYAVAGHAALECLERHGAGCDAVLLACFGDPGLFALREAAAVPVIGMAEACMAEAARFASFSIVTGGAAWKPMLERLALQLGVRNLLNVHALPPGGPELARREDLILEAISGDGADAVIVGGAALAGIAARLQPRAAVPLIDSVECGVRAAVRLSGRREAA